MIETATKKCTICGEEKPLSQFVRNYKAKDGHLSVCKDCRNKKRGLSRTPKSNRAQRSVEHLRILRELKASVSVGMKPCANCLAVKPLDSFHGHANFPDGKQSWCAKCMKADQKEKGRNRRYSWTYGLTVAEYDEMLEHQAYGCAICGTTVPGGKGNHFRVDHDHTTGTVRGLLCNSCNMGIGQLGDNSDRLIKAANYLRAYSATTHQPTEN